MENIEMTENIDDEEVINYSLGESDGIESESIYTTEDGREMYEHFRFLADKGQALLRVDKFLVARMEKTSRNRIQQAADAGCIIVNGVAVKSSYKVKPGDVISIVMDRPRYELEIIPEDIPLDIVYEDSEVLVVNKPAGLVVHPGHGNYHGTLVNALAFHFRDNPDYDVNDPRLGLVHRIDKDTSGLLVVAKTPEAKLIWACSFSIKRLSVSMLQSYGAILTLIRGLLSVTLHEIRRINCKWLYLTIQR